MTEDLIYYNSRWRYALLVVLGLAFVAGGIWLIVIGGQWIVGLLSIFFFGACAAVGIWQFVDHRPRLHISDEGITDRTLGVGLIPWTAIQDAYLNSVNGEPFVCLVLRNEEEYLQKLSPLKRKLAGANRALGFTALSINLSGVSINADQVLEYILKQSAVAHRDQPDFLTT